jgi:dipeptidyl aminopeptidase/acylaminoacyl peptidase
MNAIGLQGLGAALSVLFLALSTVPGYAQPAPLGAYGALPAVEFVSVSPSGARLASVKVEGEKRGLLVTDLASGDPIGLADIGDSKVRDVNWIGEDRLLIVMSETQSLPSIGVPKSELSYGLIFEPGARKVTPLFNRNRAVMPMLFGPAEVRQTPRGPAVFVRGFRLFDSRSLDLYRIDPATGLGRVSDEMDWDIDDYVLDAEGQVLAKAEYDRTRKRWLLLLPLGQTFMTLAWATDAPLDGPALRGMGRRPRTVVVDARRDDLIGAAGDGDELGELFEVDVDTGEWTALPFRSHPTRLIHHPQSGLLMGGVHIGPSRSDSEFFDADLAQRWTAVERAFAGRNPELVSWSDDMRQVVVFTGGQDSSGQYQLVDFARGDANIIGDVYPEIGPDQVGAVREVKYRAQDGLEIHGYLTLPPGQAGSMGLPLVVLAHGGPAARDVAGFDWWAQALASRGYAVLQANFRGSTGYGDAFMEAGYGEWGRKMQTDLSDGVQSLAREGRIDPERVCIVGGSYGGYAALAGVTLQKDVYRCAVSFGGVSDLRLMVLQEARETGRGSRAVRYWNRFMGVERLGDRQLDLLSPAHLAAQGDAPVLLMHGQDDTVVAIEQSVKMAEALARAGRRYEFIRLEGEDHWLSRADTRQRMLSEMVRFLNAHNPP